MIKSIHSLVYLALSFILCGCVSSRLIEDTRCPEVVVSEFGTITFQGQNVEVARLARTIKRAGIPRQQEVNILLSDGVDRQLRSAIYAVMLKGGYTRTIFITERKASSYITGKPSGAQP